MKTNNQSQLNVKLPLRNKITFINAIKKYYHYYILLLVPVLYFAIFKYLPMYGALLAFRRFEMGHSIFGGEFVGFHYFEMFITDPLFYRAFKNTLLISIYSLTCGFTLSILFALLLNEVKNHIFKKVVQTASYLPYFISIVVVVGMVNQILSPSTGIINHIIAIFHGPQIHFMAEPNWFKPIYVMSGLWQMVGWNAILYIAALSNINTELYEAAMIDGANRFKQVIHITIPGIMSTIIITLILSIGSMLTLGYEKVILMYNELTFSSADIIASYVFRLGLEQNNYSYATAVGLFEALISLTLITTANTVAKRISDTSLW